MDQTELRDAALSWIRQKYPRMQIQGVRYLRKTDTLIVRVRPGGKGVSLRFVAETDDSGVFTACRAITTSERKRLGRNAARYRGKNNG